MIASENASPAAGSRSLFLIECTGAHWIEIGRDLMRRGWRIALWTGAKEQAQAVHDLSPDTVYCVNHEAVRGILPRTPTSQAVVDGQMKESIANEKLIALEMMDRMDPDGRSMSYRERTLHFDRLVNFWLRTLEDLRPDAVVFSMAPHLVFDYALYVIARFRGLPTPMFDRTAFAGRLILLDHIYDAEAQITRKMVRAHEKPKLAADITAEVERIRSSRKGAYAPTFAKKITALGLQNGLGAYPYGIAGLCQHVFAELRAGASELAGRRTRTNYIKLKRRRLANSWPTLRQRVGLRVAGAFQKRVLWRRYAGLVSRPPEGSPYIYFALHFQPERATCPMAWNLGDQITVAGMVASALPTGWKLIIKEHPWQLQPRSRGEYGRSSEVYEQLAAIPNVHLAPVADDSAALTRGAQAVVTATGSAGWEAICNGVPAILFGSPWYAAAPGAFKVRSAQDCAVAIAAIAAKVAPDPKCFDRFLWALQDATVWGVLEPRLEVAEVSASEAASSMSEALNDRLSAGATDRVVSHA